MSPGSALAPQGATVTDNVRNGNGQVTITFDPATDSCSVTPAAAFTG